MFSASSGARITTVFGRQTRTHAHTHTQTNTNTNKHTHTHTHKGTGFIGKWVISKSKLAPSTIDRTPAKMLAGGDCTVCPLPIKHYEWPQFALYKSDEKKESKNDPILLIWRARYTEDPRGGHFCTSLFLLSYFRILPREISPIGVPSLVMVWGGQTLRRA